MAAAASPHPRLAHVAAAIAEPARAAMLARLLDGRYDTAGELAAHAGSAASTASQHLKSARCCCGHLAGRRGVHLHDALLATRDYEVTGPGAAGLTQWGVVPPSHATKQRLF